MKITLSWLKKFAPVTQDIEDIAQAYYSLGFGVESIKDDVLDLEITPNRGDALSIYGLAREYVSYTGNRIENYSYNEIVVKGENKIKITVKSENVLSYYGVVIENIRVINSATAIVHQLEKVDINTINNVVDITNYIMHETGIPLHAYDLDKIDHEITINETKKDSNLKTLNNKEYKLPVGSLVAFDGERIIDLVGIQGGESVAVDKGTKRILLHAPIINSKLIRKTSKEINLSTPASYRYERGVDSGLIVAAISKAIELIINSSGGEINQIIDLAKTCERKTIKINWENVKRILGTEIDNTMAKKILRNLGFEISADNIIVPAWRAEDINFEEDIIEEIARVYSYNKLKAIELKKIPYVDNIDDKAWNKEVELSNKLINEGFDEVLTYSFISKQESNQINTKSLVEIANPLSNLNQYLRDSMIPLLVDAGEKNIWMPDISFFEIGSVFIGDNEQHKVALISTKQITFINNVERFDKFSNNNKTKKNYNVFECDIDKFSDLKLNNINIKKKKKKKKKKNLAFKQFSKYPPAVRDISFLINNDINVDEIKSKLLFENILSVNIVDIYTSDKFGKDGLSYCIRIIIDNKDNKLSGDKIDETVNNMTKILKEEFNAQIR